jgi:hypothetical protein
MAAVGSWMRTSSNWHALREQWVRNRRTSGVFAHQSVGQASRPQQVRCDAGHGARESDMYGCPARTRAPRMTGAALDPIPIRSLCAICIFFPTGVFWFTYLFDWTRVLALGKQIMQINPEIICANEDFYRFCQEQCTRNYLHLSARHQTTGT